MQGRRRPQPSGTNSPSSSSSRYLARAARPHGVRSPTGTSKIRFLAVRPPGHARHPRVRGNAAHRSAAMAGGARPDPFRTRKLSRRAPMVLRGKPVGEQGAADRWTAFATRTRGGERGGKRRTPPPFFSWESIPKTNPTHPPPSFHLLFKKKKKKNTPIAVKRGYLRFFARKLTFLVYFFFFWTVFTLFILAVFMFDMSYSSGMFVSFEIINKNGEMRHFI